MKNKNLISVALALLAMAFWGSLFPVIKLGYKYFKVNTSSAADILIFAAIRFLLCGLIVCAFCLVKKEKYKIPDKREIASIALMGFFAVTLHYGFTYIGLSLTDSSKTAILKQLGTLLYVCFAFLFIKEEKFGINKLIGAIVGFLGIISINSFGGKISFSIGDILIIAASFCTVISSVMSKKSVQTVCAIWVTGISQLFGGIVLMAVGISMGGKFPQFNISAVLLLLYICIASIAGYTLYYYVQKTMDLSSLFIVKFAEPLFAVLFGFLLLNEDIFKIEYIASFILISAGIIIGNKVIKKKEKVILGKC